MEIFTLHTVDIFLQGFFLLLCIGLGLYIIFKDNDKVGLFWNSEDKVYKKNLADLSNALHAIMKAILSIFNRSSSNPSIDLKYLGFIPAIIVLSFIIGILGRGVADDWIDSNNKSHLFLKSTWSKELHKDKRVKEELFAKIDTVSYRDLARKIAFNTVFNLHPNDIEDETIYHHLYYQSKHEILSEKNNFTYLRKSQTMAEYSRVFALGFLFLMGCCFANFFIMIFRIKCKSNRRFSEVCHSLLESFKQKNITLKLDVSKIINYIDATINIDNSVIGIFLIISWCIIEYIINPYFNNYEWYNTSYILICMFVYFGILIFILLFFSIRFRNRKFIFFLYSIVYLISFSGYFVSSRTWLKSEIEVAKKVYGLYKFNHSTKDLKEIKFAKDVLCLDSQIIEKK